MLFGIIFFCRCSGLGDADIEFGACTSKNICSEVLCPKNTTCVSNPTVCLSLMHRPCPQHICGIIIFHSTSIVMYS